MYEASENAYNLIRQMAHDNWNVVALRFDNVSGENNSGEQGELIRIDITDERVTSLSEPTDDVISLQVSISGDDNDIEGYLTTHGEQTFDTGRIYKDLADNEEDYLFSGAFPTGEQVLARAEDEFVITMNIQIPKQGE